MNEKSDVVSYLKKNCQLICTQYRGVVKYLRINNGLEYINDDMSVY